MGQKNDDADGSSDSRYDFTVPADGEYFVRVRDMLKRGGEDFVYRIEAQPFVPEIAVTMPEMIRRDAQYWKQFDIPQGNQYAMVVDGADHYLGNLICRLEREKTPQHDALKMVNSVSVAFLDAYLKNNAEARAYLAGEAMASTTGQFATLDRR